MSSALRAVALLLFGASVTYADAINLTATVQFEYALETDRPRSQKGGCKANGLHNNVSRNQAEHNGSERLRQAFGGEYNS